MVDHYKSQGKRLYNDIDNILGCFFHVPHCNHHYASSCDYLVWLKATINKDSGNSSKPPSTNGFKEVPNSREKTGNSPGGKKGHKGHRLTKPKNLE